MKVYLAYGQRCESTLPLPELSLAPPGPTKFGIRMARGSEAGVTTPRRWIRWSSTDSGAEWFAVAEEQDGIRFRFADSIEYRVRNLAKGHHQIFVSCSRDTPEETIRHGLIDEVLPALLALDGYAVLHGAGVALRQRALLILGDSGAGKSTLAVAFGLSGAPVLADDCLVMEEQNGRLVVQPSYPSARIWEDAVQHFFAAPSSSLPVSHLTSKRRFRDGLAFCDHALPVGGVITLARRREREGVELRPLRGHAAIAAVLEGIKAAPRGSERPTALKTLLRLAGEVPVATLNATPRLDDLPTIMDELDRWLG